MGYLFKKPFLLLRAYYVSGTVQAAISRCDREFALSVPCFVLSLDPWAGVGTWLLPPSLLLISSAQRCPLIRLMFGVGAGCFPQACFQAELRLPSLDGWRPFPRALGIAPALRPCRDG